MKNIRILAIVFGLLYGAPIFADIGGDPEKIPGYVVVYQTDATGTVTRGSLAKLVRSVRSGADIKIGFSGTIDQFHNCDNTLVYDVSGIKHVGCNVNNRMSLVDESNLPTIRTNPYWTFYYWDSQGNWALARASIYGGNAGQSTGSESFGKTWYARIR